MPIIIIVVGGSGGGGGDGDGGGGSDGGGGGGGGVVVVVVVVVVGAAAAAVMIAFIKRYSPLSSRLKAFHVYFLLAHIGLFCCLHNPPNSGTECRIFNVRM